MKSVWGEKHARRSIRLCRRCASEILPRRLRSSSLARNALRASAKGMETPPNPQAERLRAKKARKAEKAALRSAFRTEGVVSAAVRFLLHGLPAAPVSEECADCLALQSRAA